MAEKQKRRKCAGHLEVWDWNWPIPTPVIFFWPGEDPSPSQIQGDGEIGTASLVKGISNSPSKDMSIKSVEELASSLKALHNV